MNFTFPNSLGLYVSSHHSITTESLKSRLHMSLDQFKVSCECVLQYQLSKDKITYISPGYYDLHIRMSFVWTWTVALSHWALEWHIVTSCISVCGVVSLGVWRRQHGFREPHMGVRICLPGVLTDSGAPALLVPGVSVCLHHHCHGKPPHHGHGDL